MRPRAKGKICGGHTHPWKLPVFYINFTGIYASKNKYKFMAGLGTDDRRSAQPLAPREQL
jgi:hypothetical protein